ncbi:MAG: thioredoxin domain-containing protein [Bacteroidota bacterium]
MFLHTNHLISETSPYLLQHAHNPVNWYPWGDEALQLAKSENKPILVSIGYSACHGCHVMERESFEDEATAKIMNDHFINIKVDREERPDLDHIYMDAVQAMTGSGGWPLNVFLTPDKRPFYGGTYFPPVRAFNRSSWKEILLGVSKAFSERRHEIDAQAENLTDHILQSNGFGLQAVPEQAKDDLFSKEKLEEAFTNCMKKCRHNLGRIRECAKVSTNIYYPVFITIYFFTKEESALKQAY